MLIIANADQITPFWRSEASWGALVKALVQGQAP